MSKLTNRTEAARLACPRCQALDFAPSYLTSYDPCLIDLSLVEVTHIDIGTVQTRVEAEEDCENPSSDRYAGVAIGFECAECGGNMELLLVSDEVGTSLAWRYGEPNPIPAIAEASRARTGRPRLPLPPAKPEPS